VLIWYVVWISYSARNCWDLRKIPRICGVGDYAVTPCCLFGGSLLARRIWVGLCWWGRRRGSLWKWDTFLLCCESGGTRRFYHFASVLSDLIFCWQTSWYLLHLVPVPLATLVSLSLSFPRCCWEPSLIRQGSGTNLMAELWVRPSRLTFRWFLEGILPAGLRCWGASGEVTSWSWRVWTGVASEAQTYQWQLRQLTDLKIVYLHWYWVSSEWYSESMPPGALPVAYRQLLSWQLWPLLLESIWPKICEFLHGHSFFWLVNWLWLWVI